MTQKRRRTGSKLTPMQRVEIQEQLRTVRKQKEEAVAAHEFERAAQLKSEETRLYERLRPRPPKPSDDWIVLSNDDAE